jgi:hypothetical protein
MTLLAASASAAVSFLFFLIRSSFGPPLTGQLCAMGSRLGPAERRVRQRVLSMLAARAK